MIEDLQGHHFQSHVLQRSQQAPVLLKFYGPNCGPCRALAPLLHQLDQQHANLTIVAMDASKNPQYGQHYGVHTVPTLLMFRNGQLVGRHDGSPGTTQGLQQFVGPHLA